MLSNLDPLRSSIAAAIGIVIIGRNEGDRLQRCLGSLCASEPARGAPAPIVYVDSASTDGSVAMARARGVEVVELDMSKPFTAARARNEGCGRLLERHPPLELVFFVDGDCEVSAGWLETAQRFLSEHPEVAVVCGRRRERYPDRSVYNLLCDIEWDVPPGESKACGGDAVVRVRAFRQVNGFRSDLICGEEPELCVRLRQAGWRVWRLNSEMTLHDAALYRFGQWWRRMVRGGYAFAQGAHLHGAPPERHWVRECRRVWMWGLCLPAIVVLLTATVSPWSLLLLAAYPLQVVRLALLGRRTLRENWWRAGALVLGNFPEMIGQLKFNLDRHRRMKSTLIEYK
jgi:GT2 family glycosyltransferase